MIGHRIEAGVKTIWESAADRARLLRSRQNLISLWSIVAPTWSPCRFGNEFSLGALLEQRVLRGHFSLPVWRFASLIEAPWPLPERSLCSLRHARPEHPEIDTPRWRETEEKWRDARDSVDSWWSAGLRNARK